MKKTKLTLVSMIMIILFLAAGLASGLQVGGAVLEKEVSPGEHLSHLMLISIGASDAPTDFQIDVLGNGQTLGGKNIMLNSTADSSPYSARPFLKVSSDRFPLAPGETKEVTLEGDIPAESSGGKYALVYIHSAPQGNNSSSVGVATGVIVPVYLTIKGSELLYTGEIQNLTLVKPVNAEGQNISFIFKNTGNHHYRIQSVAVVKDNEGNIVANASLTSSRASIIPNTSRLIEFSIKPESPLKPGDYSANVTVNMVNSTVLASKEIQFKLS